jgi:hypothetical protein
VDEKKEKPGNANFPQNFEMKKSACSPSSKCHFEFAELVYHVDLSNFGERFEPRCTKVEGTKKLNRIATENGRLDVNLNAILSIALAGLERP